MDDNIKMSLEINILNFGLHSRQSGWRPVTGSGEHVNKGTSFKKLENLLAS
jgi:hypothetical protein